MLVVVGAGSIGGYVAWQLARAGHELTLAVRTPFDRLVVTDAEGDHPVDARIVTDPDDVGAAEWVFLSTKAHQTDTAAAWLRRTCGPGTRGLVVMQNGVEHRERVAPHVRATAVVPCVVSCAAEAVAPGRVVHHGFASFEVPHGPLADQLVTLFAGTAATVTPVEDFTTAVWRKLIANVTTSPITTLTLRRIEVMSQPAVHDLALGLARECVAVANAAGAHLTDDDARAAVAQAADVGETTPELGSSMLYDRLAGRPLEHDALTGAVVRFGRRHGVATPLNEAVLALLAACGPVP